MSHMSEDSDSDRTAEWFDDRSRADPCPGTSHVKAIPDADTETVTFAWRRPEDGDTTTAWITAHADIVVSGSDMQ
jgi:hypothetical protein